ncbi:unnamed protein product, partial [Cyprideis torosa]
MNIVHKLMRKKYIDYSHISSTHLNRVLTTFDLTALGIGSTLGVGVYVLAGEVARDSAGPAVTISFLVAAIASVFAGLCYAEFGARVPKAGSAYVYSYVTVGEIIAFVIGWNLVLEYLIGTASVARGYSGYLDSLLDDRMKNKFKELLPIHDHVPDSVAEYLSEYPDFFAFGITFALAILLSVGVKESTRFNGIFTCLNLLVICFVLICGAFKADLDNWKIDPNNLPIKPEDVPDSHDGKDVDVGDGGFMPFGWSGVLAGAATCFYGFVGFDAVATAGEETINPHRAIPIAIVVSLFFIFCSYFGISTVLTMMWPYYAQDKDSPLPYVFEKVGWDTARWIVSIGALFGLSTSLLGAMFPLPRVIYAMASDGLIFRFLAYIHPKFHTPFVATLIAGFLGGFLAAIFDLSALVDMMSIGTLLAYTIVAACVLILRYSVDTGRPIGSRPVLYSPSKGSAIELNATGSSDTSRLVKKGDEPGLLAVLFNTQNIKTSNEQSSNVGTWGCLTISILIAAFNATIIHAENQLADGEVWAVILAAVLGGALLLNFIIILRQPQSRAEIPFKVPLVPLVPCLSIFMNVYLMLKLSDKTWVRFAVWMVLGFLIYFLYGIRRSMDEGPEVTVIPEEAYVEEDEYHKHHHHHPHEHEHHGRFDLGKDNAGFVAPEDPEAGGIVLSLSKFKQKDVPTIVIEQSTPDHSQNRKTHNTLHGSASPRTGFDRRSFLQEEMKAAGEIEKVFDELENEEIVVHAAVEETEEVDHLEEVEPLEEEETREQEAVDETLNQFKDILGDDGDETPSEEEGELDELEEGMKKVFSLHDQIRDSFDKDGGSSEESVEIDEAEVTDANDETLVMSHPQIISSESDEEEVGSKVESVSEDSEEEEQLSAHQSLPVSPSKDGDGVDDLLQIHAEIAKSFDPEEDQVVATFERVPSSSADSPLAQKVGSKFTVIPVDTEPLHHSLPAPESGKEAPRRVSFDVEEVAKRLHSADERIHPDHHHHDRRPSIKDLGLSFFRPPSPSFQRQMSVGEEEGEEEREGEGEEEEEHEREGEEEEEHEGEGEEEEEHEQEGEEEEEHEQEGEEEQKDVSLEFPPVPPPPPMPSADEKPAAKPKSEERK